MSVEARWICHTCKTICCAGGRRDILNYKSFPEGLDLEYIDMASYMVVYLGRKLIIEDYAHVPNRVFDFLEHLRKWIRRHGNHAVNITNDHGLDMFDLSGYHMETTAGVIGKTWEEFHYGKVPGA